MLDDFIIYVLLVGMPLALLIFMKNKLSNQYSSEDRIGNQNTISLSMMTFLSVVSGGLLAAEKFIGFVGKLLVSNKTLTLAGLLLISFSVLFFVAAFLVNPDLNTSRNKSENQILKLKVLYNRIAIILFFSAAALLLIVFIAAVMMRY